MDTSYEEEEEDEVAEAAPFISRPAIPTVIQDNRQAYEKQFAVHVILTSVVFQCAAYYYFDTNLFLTLQTDRTFNWTNAHSSTALYIFEGIEFIVMIIFGIVSDAKLERAKMIMIGLPLFLTGFIFFTVITSGKTSLCHFDMINNQTLSSVLDERCAASILPTIVLTAIGAGAVRANLIAFGADQIQESAVTSRYFDKCVVAINLGSLIEVLMAIYIPYDQGYFTSYLVANLMLVTAALLFLIGWRYYVHVKPYDSAVLNCLAVVINAFQSWHQYKKKKHTTTSHGFTEEEQESFRIDEHPSTFLDFAQVVNHGKFPLRVVNDVKSLRNTFIIFILVFPYRLIYYQLYSTFVSQGTHMAHSGNNRVSLIFISELVTVIIGIVVLNMFVYPYLHARNRSLAIVTKFLISICFAFITMCISGGIELLRQHYCPTDQSVSDLTVYATLPQAISMGLAQLFGLLASFEFAYFVAPRSAQSFSISLLLCSIAIASYIRDAYISVLRKYSVDLDFRCPSETIYEWHYYTYFFILAGLQLIFLVVFLVCWKKIRSIKLNREQMHMWQFLQKSPLGRLNNI